MKTYGSLFTGFGGACLGARAAGLELTWGNELDPAIAEVGNYNLGGHIRVGNVLEQNPRDYERVDVLHMSPPCTRASVANGSAEVNEDGLKESALDIALANKCIEFIETLQPECVTLENVWGYRVFQSWKGGRKCEGIQSALYRLGYWVSVEHVNSADFGVPQTRRRMIVRAVRGGWVPYLPAPVPWIGWYSAIEDILHTLPDSQFAPWQLARLPEELRNHWMIGSENAGQEWGGTKWGTEPSFTISTGQHPRALLVAQGKYGDDLVMAPEDKPSFTITANSNQTGIKAFIVDVKNSRNFGKGPTRLPAESPVFTIQASQAKGMPRAFDGVARVVAMTPRALARFQSFPDGAMYPGSVRLSKPYILPDSKTLAAKGIGNAVCPLVMQRIYEGLKD